MLEVALLARALLMLAASFAQLRHKPIRAGCCPEPAPLGTLFPKPLCACVQVGLTDGWPYFSPPETSYDNTQ